MSNSTSAPINSRLAQRQAALRNLYATLKAEHAKCRKKAAKQATTVEQLQQLISQMMRRKLIEARCKVVQLQPRLARLPARALRTVAAYEAAEAALVRLGDSLAAALSDLSLELDQEVMQGLAPATFQALFEPRQALVRQAATVIAHARMRLSTYVANRRRRPLQDEEATILDIFEAARVARIANAAQIADAAQVAIGHALERAVEKFVKEAGEAEDEDEEEVQQEVMNQATQADVRCGPSPLIISPTNQIYMPTFRALAGPPDGPQSLSVRIFVDSGSCHSFIAEEAAVAMKLPKKSIEPHTVRVFGGGEPLTMTEQVTLRLRSQHDSRISNLLQAMVMPGAYVSPLPPPSPAIAHYAGHRGLLLADSGTTAEPAHAQVDILLGEDYAESVLFEEGMGRIKPLASLTLEESRYGWLLKGYTGCKPADKP